MKLLGGVVQKDGLASVKRGEMLTEAPTLEVYPSNAEIIGRESTNHLSFQLAEVSERAGTTSRVTAAARWMRDVPGLLRSPRSVAKIKLKTAEKVCFRVLQLKILHHGRV